MSYSKEIPRDIKIENIKALYPQKRQEAKGIEFAIGYGGDFNTISTNAGIPLEEAKEIYNSYMKGFPGVKKYQDYCRKALIKDGFILMNPITKHRCHIPDWENKYLPIRDQMREEGFWEYYRELKQDPFSEELRNIRDYFKFKADYEKKAINYRIQNRGAMCTKLSGILFFNWIIKNNYQNKVKICIQAHDKILS